MTAYCWRSLVGSVVVFALSSPSTASAKGFVLVTWGETISHVGDASPQAKEMHGRIKVGYKYGYFGVFWIDLWTQGGTYCIFDGKRYDSIQPAEAARLLGMSESNLSTPFLYRVPLGWLIFGPLIVVGIMYVSLNNGSGYEITPLFQDARYQKALAVVNEQYGKQPAVAGLAQSAGLPATIDDDSRFRIAFEAGVQHLIGVGIPREDADPNLARIVYLSQVRNVEEARRKGMRTDAVVD